MQGPMFLSAEQVLLSTLLVKLAVMAAAATILVRFRRFQHFLIFEHRPWPDRVTFAVSLGVLLSAGVVARLLLGYNAADLTLEGAFLAGLIDGPYAGVTVGALVGVPPLPMANGSRCRSRSAADSRAAASGSCAPRSRSGTSRRSSSPACRAACGGCSAPSRSIGRSSCCSHRSRSSCSLRRWAS